MYEDKSVKPDYTLIPIVQELRVVKRFQMGAEKYARDDWANARYIDRNRYYASLHRHLRQAQAGNRDEDHLAAVIVNAMIIMHIEKDHEQRGA